MIGALLDTHAALWYLLASSRLSPSVVSFCADLRRAEKRLSISAVSVLEVLYLVEKKRLPEAALSQLIAAVADPHADIACLSFDKNMAIEARRIPRDQVPDMPDRIIAATALQLGVPLITRDRRIQAANIETIW